MKTALFIMLPVPSHYNACFGLANHLRSKGAHVIITGTPDLREHVEAQGFEFAVLWCLEEYVIHNWRVALGLCLKSVTDRTFSQIRYREFLRAIQQAERLCQLARPDEIYIDQHLNHYYFLLKANWPTITLVNTKLPTRKAPGIPPLTCAIPFRQNLFYRLFAQILWIQYRTQQILESALKRIVFCGVDDLYFLKRIIQKTGIDFQLQRLKNNALYESVKGVPIVHVRPRFLEYEWYKLDNNECFLYFPYQRYQKHGLSQTELWPHLQSLRKANVKLVYASLGTLSYSSKEVGIKFFQRLIEAISSMDGLYLIIAAGDLKPVLTVQSTNNVSIMKWVPQVELLPHCALMITHGGMNSICECLFAGVPMLAYPLSFDSDQPGNAARIVAKGFGLQGNIQRDTKMDIRSKIRQLLTKSAYRQNMRQICTMPDEHWPLTTDLAESR